jgi:uncharacterized membrane-anchored protein YhcB (DUF1043 family)
MDNYAIIALIVGVVMALIRVIEHLVSLMFKKNGNKTDEKQCIDIAVIKNQLENYEKNHFPTINKRLDKIEEKIDSIYDLLIKK